MMIGTPPVFAIFIEFLGDMPVAKPCKFWSFDFPFLLVLSDCILSPPRPNFQTFWEPLGKTILKETLKV